VISDNQIVYQYTLIFHKHSFCNSDVYMICFVDSEVQLASGFAVSIFDY